MQKCLDRLTSRMLRLEREIRLYRAVLVAILCVVVFAGSRVASTPTDSIPDILVARKLVIRDADGKDRIVLSVQDSGPAKSAMLQITGQGDDPTNYTAYVMTDPLHKKSGGQFGLQDIHSLTRVGGSLSTAYDTCCRNGQAAFEVDGASSLGDKIQLTSGSIQPLTPVFGMVPCHFATANSITFPSIVISSPSWMTAHVPQVAESKGPSPYVWKQQQPPVNCPRI